MCGGGILWGWAKEKETAATSENVEPTLGHVHSVKIQICLPIRPVWSESSLGAFIAKNKIKILHNENSDQIARMRRLIWVFV